MKRILIVDDEAPYRDMIAFLLESRGLETRVAEDVEQGARELRSFAPDAVILDYMFNGEPRGYRLAEIARTHHPEVKTVLMTGFPEFVLDAAEGRTMFDGYLGKPFSFDDLVEILFPLIDFNEEH